MVSSGQCGGLCPPTYASRITVDGGLSAQLDTISQHVVSISGGVQTTVVLGSSCVGILSLQTCTLNGDAADCRRAEVSLELSPSAFPRGRRMGRTQICSGAWRPGPCTTSWMRIVGASGFGRHWAAASFSRSTGKRRVQEESKWEQRSTHTWRAGHSTMGGAEEAPAADRRWLLHDLTAGGDVA